MDNTAAQPASESASVGPKTSTDAPVESKEWNSIQRVLFRFAFCYLLLYGSSTGIIQVILFNGTAYFRLWHRLVQWMAKRAVGIEITVFSNSSFDTTYDYFQLLCILAFALVVTLIWTLVDSQRRHYRQLLDWLRIFVRYMLALVLVVYGIGKIFSSQFPPPRLEELMDTYGDSSPMRLLWTFMGYSRPYSFLGGAAELTSAALLFFRRTTTLGALVGAAVMSNVVMLNFCYDVPVKLYSSHLLLMTIFLAASDGERLINVLLLNRSTAPVSMESPLKRGWMRTSGLAAKYLLLGVVLMFIAFSTVGHLRMKRETSPIFGLYRVEEFSRNGQPVSMDDPKRWKMMSSENPDEIWVRFANDTARYFPSKYDPSHNSVILRKKDKEIGNKDSVFSYYNPDPNHLILQGQFQNELVTIRMRREELELLTRGFHWVNESKYFK